MPDLLMLDRAQFRRLIDNLLSNAVKYSPLGALIRVLTEEVNGIFKIAIEDEGPGIPEGEMHKLFTHFGKTVGTNRLAMRRAQDSASQSVRKSLSCIVAKCMLRIARIELARVSLSSWIHRYLPFVT